MASERKIAANRLNARKSTGPRTARGRSRASGNAWRHGWSVAKIGQSAVSADVERMAKVICGEHATPALYEQAVIIAECEIVLLNLRCARVAAIERSIAGRKLERPNQRSDFSTHKELSLTIRALASGDPRPATRLLYAYDPCPPRRDGDGGQRQRENRCPGVQSNGPQGIIPATADLFRRLQSGIRSRSAS
jgi:hypothetical protein